MAGVFLVATVLGATSWLAHPHIAAQRAPILLDRLSVPRYAALRAPVLMDRLAAPRRAAQRAHPSMLVPVDAALQIPMGTTDAFKALSFLAVSKVIEWAVPAALIGLAVYAGTQIGGGDDDDGENEELLVKLLGRRSEPAELLKIDVFDSKLESFDYSFIKAEISQAEALRRKQLADLARAFGAVGDLDVSQLQRLRRAEAKLKARTSRTAKRVARLLPKLRALMVDQGAESAGEDHDGPAEEVGEADAPALFEEEDEDEEDVLARLWASETQTKVKAVQEELRKLSLVGIKIEMDFVQEVSMILTPAQRRKFRELLVSPRVRGSRGLLAKVGVKGRQGTGPSWTDGTVDAISPLYRLERAAAEPAHAAPPAAGALPAAAGSTEPGARPPPSRVFVLSFDGDVQASQVANLREELTAVLRSASAGDEVVLKLNTGGGTVTGYGLAASQLERVKSAGLTLTICVEEVAASGGYMMACVASPGRLFASPFAVLGSIGVISELPNVYTRLRKEGIEFLTVTAGKFKRTLTPFKKPSQKDFDKSKADIEQVYALFKTFVARNRPQLDIDKVATGETWFGPDALERNLVDALITSDDVILNLAKNPGTRVYNIKYEPRTQRPALAELFADESSGGGRGGRGLLGRLVSVLARAVAVELSTAASDELLRSAGGSAAFDGSLRGSGPSARRYADQVLAKTDENSAMLR